MHPPLKVETSARATGVGSERIVPNRGNQSFSSIGREIQALSGQDFGICAPLFDLRRPRIFCVWHTVRCVDVSPLLHRV